MSDPDLRASDAEREAAAQHLRRSAGEGRLDVAELEDRLQDAYGARTHADLDALLADLPARPVAAPAPAAPPAVPADDDADGTPLWQHLSSYGGVMVMLVVIWLLTGAGYPWPIWPALGWGIPVALHALNGARRPGADR